MIPSVAKRIVKKSFHAVGLEIRKRETGREIVTEDPPPKDAPPAIEVNQVLPDVSLHPGLQRLAATRVRPPIVLLGTAPDLKTYRAFLDAREIEWNWDAEVTLPDGAQVVICSVPSSGEHWRVIRELKRKHGARVTGLQELLLPFTPIVFAQARLDYFVKTIDDIAPLYLGEQWFGPIDRLNELVPLSGKRVIEFGPFDGAQTAGLVHHGVRELVCIEARAENFIKTLIAKEVFGWSNVRLVMDDMHNADAVKYGRFDLAFCHGTYYHAISPFVLLENLVSLSDAVFVGGFVLKEGAPFTTMTYEGEEYRVQPYTEGTGFTAGINTTSYFFHPDDLTRFFSTRGYRISVMDDEESALASNRFFRFFAAR